MAKPTLALNSDPFATPILTPTDLPTLPEPAAQIPSRSQSHSAYDLTGRPSTFERENQHGHASHSHKSVSISSVGHSSTKTPMSSLDLEKDRSVGTSRDMRKKKQTSSRDQHHRERDPEKAVHSSSRQRNFKFEADRVAYLEDDDEEQCRQVQQQKAGKILLFLAGPCVVLSFMNAFWTFVSVLIVTLTQPVRLCARRPTFGQQLGGLLGPALNLQLKRIYTPLPPHADEDTSYRTGMLLAVQLLSPILSLGVMIAAWVVAVFWLSSAVVGDPAGNDKRDDGKETVLGLRKWWESWLLKAITGDDADYT